jgi:hypothetical protein
MFNFLSAEQVDFSVSALNWFPPVYQVAPVPRTVLQTPLSSSARFIITT